MKKILYIATLLFFSVAAKSQTYVADTTDLKLIPSVNNGKIATIVATDYQGSYRATNVAQTPNGANIFASVKSGWYWVKIQDNNPSYQNVAVASKFKGIYNDGTSIDSADFHDFIVATSGQSVYFPKGTYNISSDFDNAELTADIDWYGDGRKSIINNFNGVRVKGNIDLLNLSFKDGGILFRLDAFTSGGEVKKDHFIAENIYLQNVQMFTRDVLGTNYVAFNIVDFNNITHDTINSSVSGGAFMQWTSPVKTMRVRNILVQHNTDSNYVSIFRVQGENVSGAVTQDSSYLFENIVMKNIITSETNAPAPVTNKLLMTLNGEGADIIVRNIEVYECNLPQFDIRGTPSQVIAEGWKVNCPSIVGTAASTDYFLINKSRKYTAGDWAFIMRDCDISIGGDGDGELAPILFENEGDRLISNTMFLFSSSSSGIRAGVGEAQTHPTRLRVENSVIKNTSATGIIGFWINDDVSIIEFQNSFIQGENSIFGQAVTSDSVSLASFDGCTFYGGFQAPGAQRQIKHLRLTNCNFVGNQNYNFSSTEKTSALNNYFYDDTITDPNNNTNLNFEFGNATSVDFIGNDFAIDSASQMGSLSFTNYANGLDSLRYNYNTGYIRTQFTTCVPVRVESIDYVEILGNNIEYKNGLSDGQFVYIEAGDTIDYAYVDGNRVRAAGTGLDFFFAGGAGSYINNLKWGDNELLDAIEDGNITTVFDNITVHNAVDKDGNAYTTVDTLAFYQLIPDVITASSNRDLASSDVENRVRCTTSITLTIPLNFSAMAVEQTITVLKAFAGTSITITGATGVTVNGSSGGSATITGDYKAGIIYKVSTNTYEVY